MTTKKPAKEILVLACDGGEVMRAANRLLKPYGLRIKLRGSYQQLADQRYLRLEELPKLTQYPTGVCTCEGRCFCGRG